MCVYRVCGNMHYGDNIIDKFFPCLVFLFLWQQTPTYALANEVSPIRKCNGNMFTNEARNNYIYKPIIHVTTDEYQHWNAL